MIISFDQDHTLAWGNPPGPIAADHLRRVKEMGHTIGTGGGAGGEEQRAQWLANGIEPDFALSKGELIDLPRRFPGQAFVHVDNDPVAIEGFRVMTPEEFVSWLTESYS